MNKMVNKKVLSFLVALTMIIGLMVSPAQSVQAETNNTINVTILHTNDTHGRVVGDSKIIGIDTIAAIKNSIENSILVDAGDTLHGIPFATMNKGADIIELMNMAGYDLMVPGNHDFNYGYERLLELSNIANNGGNGFEIISANTVKNNKTILNANSIKIVDGVKIGFFGLSSPETAYKTNPNNIPGITFENPIDTAKAQVEALKAQGAEVIVALAHIGDDESTLIKSTDIAKSVEGIDVIIDGHSHSKYENGLVVKNTLIASTGEYEANLGKITLTINKDTKELVATNAMLINKETAATFTPDADVKAKVDSVKAAQEVILSTVVGTNEIELDGVRGSVRAGETNLGNLITDAMLYNSGAEIAITNGGGIRASIDKGDITKGEVIAVLPFGNFIVTKYLTGAQIKDVLEHGVQFAPELAGSFAHVGGMTFAYDVTKAAGERVTEMKINGQALDMDKKYLVATNDFISAGGDSYPHFGDIKTENEFSALDEALVNYIEKLGKVNYTKEGRITVITAVDKVVASINNIPTLDKLALQDKEYVASVRAQYDALTDAEKTLVSAEALNKLVAAEAKILELENAKEPETGVTPEEDNNSGDEDSSNNGGATDENTTEDGKGDTLPETGGVNTLPILLAAMMVVVVGAKMALARDAQ